MNESSITPDNTLGEDPYEQKLTPAEYEELAEQVARAVRGPADFCNLLVVLLTFRDAAKQEFAVSRHDREHVVQRVCKLTREVTHGLEPLVGGQTFRHGSILPGINR